MTTALRFGFRDRRIKLHELMIDRQMNEHFRLWRESPKAKAHARAFRRTHGSYCDVCWWRPGDFAWFKKRRLVVHHVDYCDPTGEERFEKFRLVCDPHCHISIIHRRHRAYNRRRPYWRRNHWPYPEILRKITDRAIRRGWWRRALRGRPT